MQHEKVVAYRKQYGNNWITIFPDGLEIPWRQLTLQEFLDYSDLISSGRYTEIEVEDEIFTLCVLDTIFSDNIDILTSGTVATVVGHILQASGPATITNINEDLDWARRHTDDFMSQAATLICSVYPAYKPEELFNMKYSDFMKRLAMAERRLLELGILSEPLQALSPEQAAAPPPQQQPLEKPSDRKRREYLEQRQAELAKKLGDLNSKPEGVITKDKMKDGALSFVPDLSMDPQDHLINKKRIAEAKSEALAGLEHIYPEYFKMIREGKKITPDVINQVKGTTSEEIEAKHEAYTKKILEHGAPLPPPKQELPKKPIRIKRK